MEKPSYCQICTKNRFMGNKNLLILMVWHIIKEDTSQKSRLVLEKEKKLEEAYIKRFRGPVLKKMRLLGYRALVKVITWVEIGLLAIVLSTTPWLLLKKNNRDNYMTTELQLILVKDTLIKLQSKIFLSLIPNLIEMNSLSRNRVQFKLRIKTRISRWIKTRRDLNQNLIC